MNPDLQTFAQDVEELVAHLPAPIRELFSKGDLGSTVKTIVQKNGLRIDQGAVVEREIIRMLLGLTDPAGFSKALTEEGRVDEAAINTILQDVNEKIFIPLQAKMREGERPTQATPAPRPPAAGVPSYKPPPPPAPKPPQAQTLSPQPKPPMPQPAVRPTPPAQPSAPHTAPPPANLPGAMPENRLLSDHEVQHISVLSGSAPTPRPGVQTQPPPQQPQTKPPEPQVKAPEPPKPPADYSADPYREPIDLT